jgi:hypothetical protein
MWYLLALGIWTVAVVMATRIAMKRGFKREIEVLKKLGRKV